jgi:Ca2+-binding RTX toxin-like protein
MMQKYIPRITIITLGAIILLSAANAIAASNTVSSSRLDEKSTAIAINDKKPAACSALNLTAIFQCPRLGGTCTGTKNSELVLGSIYTDTITGKGGTDCILGGDGNDTLNGNNGGDICIGGAGDDTFIKCETCTGGPGIDNFNSCGFVTDWELGE